MITLTYILYQICNAYGVKNGFTVFYENIITTTMIKIKVSESEECKGFIRNILFAYSISTILSINFINRILHLDIASNISISSIFILAFYGFLSKTAFLEIKHLMLKLILFGSVMFLFFIALIEKSDELTVIYFGSIVALFIILLFFFISNRTGNGIVFLSKKIATHCLSQENPIKVLILFLNIIFLLIPVVINWTVKLL